MDLDMVAATPTTAGSKSWGRAYPMVAARQSARLSQSRILLDGRVPTISEKAALRAAARDWSSGTRTSPPAPSSYVSRFFVLGCEPVSRLAVVATDSGIVSRGEKGPILEQISAICAKEKLGGGLAEARACAARGEPTSPEHTNPGHRETRGGAASLVKNVAGTPMAVPPRCWSYVGAPHMSQSL
ncbi:hypothetical protein D1007_23594 [Hordeum vulgare]|nr:hypothetical protein D1007_23594 [Hordeum vulgare]